VPNARRKRFKVLEIHPTIIFRFQILTYEHQRLDYRESHLVVVVLDAEVDVAHLQFGEGDWFGIRL
jgi:hypothetical protein